MSEYTHIFKGTAFTSKSATDVHILKDYLFFINADGMIVKTVAPEQADYQQLLITYQDQNNFHALAEGQYFLPGFVDLHVHAPQWAQSGTAFRHSSLRLVKYIYFPYRIKILRFSICSRSL